MCARSICANRMSGCLRRSIASSVARMKVLLGMMMAMVAMAMVLVMVLALVLVRVKVLTFAIAIAVVIAIVLVPALLLLLLVVASLLQTPLRYGLSQTFSSSCWV